MKRLSVFSIRSFIGPFLVTFAISMFILIMQFFWKYIDDLMGKGIETFIIVELLFYVSASLIPLALPLAILLSSIMTMGNLSENNELTALKASGLSLYRILKPLTVVVFLIAVGTFYFANYIIPIANYKWHSIIFDIQNTKIASIITPGVYTKELDGYAIKVASEDPKGIYNDIIIQDLTNQNELKTIRAKEATLYKANNGKYLFFNLVDGTVSEELATQHPVYSPDGQRQVNESSNRPARRTKFDQATYKIDLSGFSLNKSDDDLFKDSYEMLTVFQLQHELDSVLKSARGVQENFLVGFKNSHEYFQSKSMLKMLDTVQNDVKYAKTPLTPISKLTNQEQLSACTASISKLDNKIKNLSSQFAYKNGMNKNIQNYWVEFHRKFALTYAIIVLFFVGAPLGAIVKKGGFGAPVVIASLLFMVYFVLNTIGENLIFSEVLSPFIGMWFPSIILTPIALILLRAAANDSPVFDKEAWVKLFRIFKRKHAHTSPHK